LNPPLPPPDIDQRRPENLLLGTGAIFHRFYTSAFDPTYFDRGRGGRLNAPDGLFGVLYAAATRGGAFAETFLRVPGRTLLPPDLISSRAYVAFRVTRPLKLAKLTGSGLARVGATAEVTHGSLPYDIPQSWSAALHGHPGGFDGIAYTARHDDEELCFAVFERASDAIEEVEREIDLEADWFYDLLDRYGLGLAA